jgi:hypothetical protein
MATQPNLPCNDPEAATLRLTFPVQSWDNSDACTWLKQLSDYLYNMYMPCFKKYGIKGSSLVQLSQDDLLKMGIIHQQHRAALLHNLKLLQEYEQSLHLNYVGEGLYFVFILVFCIMGDQNG